MAGRVIELKIDSPEFRNYVSERNGIEQVEHRFRVYATVENAKECVLEWWEKSDKPYDYRMPANTWTNMYTIDPNAMSDVFSWWHNARINQPVGLCTKIPITDIPGLPVELKIERTLFFEIRIREIDSTGYEQRSPRQRVIRARQYLNCEKDESGNYGQAFEIIANNVDEPVAGDNSPPTW